MTIVKRGSEKLMSEESGLTQLTAEELSMVAGGISPYHGFFPDIWCPNGICGDDIFREPQISLPLETTIQDENVTLNFSNFNQFENTRIDYRF